jgi:hypothetical protein
MKVVVAVAVALFAAANASAATPLEAKVQTAYSIKCLDPWPYATADAVSDLAGRTAYLQAGACDVLALPPEVDFRYANDLLALLHELAHIGWQSRNESTVECFALFVFRWEARHRFGFTRSGAEALYRIAWQVHQLKSAAYQGCAFMPRDPIPG